jgi:hypothetical protein
LIRGALDIDLCSRRELPQQTRLYIPLCNLHYQISAAHYLSFEAQMASLCFMVSWDI